MTVRYKEGSMPERARAERRRRDERNAKLPGADGAPARMRLAYGYLVDFMIEEMARSGEHGEEGLDAVFAAYGSNFENAIVNLAMNDPQPQVRAVAFLTRLVSGVVKRLAELQRGELTGLDGFAELDIKRGEIGDLDFRKRNGD
jgi:hypothetical protein